MEKTTVTIEYKMLSQAASYGVPAASTNDAIAVQKNLVDLGYIKFAGWRQNSMTPRYAITEKGRARLAELTTQ